MDYTINNHLYEEKNAGDQLTHTEWNNLVSDVNAANSNAGGGGSGVVTVTDSTPSGGDATVDVAIVSGNQTVGSPNVIQLTKKKKGVNTTVVSGNNINIEPRESVGSTKGGNIALKPGDDIELCSHHRIVDNKREVSIKAMNGSKLSFDGTTEIDEYPVDLQLNAANITLTTKDKATYISDINAERASQSEDPTNDAANVMNITVNSAKNTRGYLKVRAQAIDLRSESHGGIALQPKGTDGTFENKIKFEHGGGDGLEFGTFNTQHTSLYTTDYRFKKDGIIRLATRTTVASDKADPNDATTALKYVKNQNDDFYDNIDINDPTCTWEDIVKFTAWAKANKSGKDWASIWPDPQA